MRLVIEDEAGTRSIVPFAGDEIVVGRAADGVTFRLEERNVSRRHARFLRQAGAVFVEDLGSLTGTRVNGERIAGRRRLRDGDLVQIGDYDLAVLADGAVAAEPGAPPPLPSLGSGDPNVVTTRLPPFPEGLAPSPAAPRRRGRTVRLSLVAGAVALALGIAVGFAVGVWTAPDRPAVTRP